jgi:two-component sensor histidine kinase
VNELTTEARAVQSRAPLAATGLILLFLLLFAGLATFLFWQGYRDTFERAEAKAISSAQLVATNVEWIVETARQALRRIDSAVGDDLSEVPGGAVGDLSEAVQSLPGNVKTYVVDAAGETKLSTDPNVQPINITDRPYFSELAAGKEEYISELLISRLNGAQIFVISRRLERDGVFQGAAIISIDAIVMAEIWSSVDLVPASTVSLIRDDGRLVARFPMLEGPMDVSNTPLFTRYLPEAPQGSFEATSQRDGVARIVGYQRVQGAPLVAAASLDRNAAFAPFWRNTWTTLLLAAPAMAGLGIVSIWIAQLLVRDANRRQALAKALATNQMLFREIHHRVKNNLQAINSLVRMQPIPDAAKQDMGRRIAAMVAVHEHIYRSDQYLEVDAAQYIPNIVESLGKSYGREIEIDYEVQTLVIDRDHAMPLGLIVNEVISNALKYAFPEGYAARLHVELEKLPDGKGRLVISDNGIGFDPETAVKGMGSRLISGLAAQLLGTYEYTLDNGTAFILTFELVAGGRQAEAAA